MRLDEKRVVITGASSGLGKAMAHELAARGARLVLAARRLHRLQAVAEEIASEHPGAPPALPVQCDVTDRASVRSLIASAAETMGGVDLLVNNAGVSVYGVTERTSDIDYQILLAVNFLGPIHATMEALPLMRDQGGGCIVNIASLAALHGVPYLSAYGASKAALACASQSLRSELGQSGVRVLVVYPGYTDTPLFANEKKVGGARRPPGPYRRADRVAREIVRAIESDKQELVLTAQGKAMALVRGVFPKAIQLAMYRIASRLREDKVISHA